jgi:hypothetical protein
VAGAAADIGVAGAVTPRRAAVHAHHLVQAVVVIDEAQKGASHDRLRNKEGSQRETGQSGGPEEPEHQGKR